MNDIEVNIIKVYNNCKIELFSFNSLCLYSYLDKNNIENLDNNFKDCKNEKKVINTNEDNEYIKIFPNESVLIPLGFKVITPNNYFLKIEPDYSNVLLRGFIITYDSLICKDDQDYILIKNDNTYMKKLYHNTLLGYAHLVKQEIFDINIGG